MIYNIKHGKLENEYRSTIILTRHEWIFSKMPQKGLFWHNLNQTKTSAKQNEKVLKS